MSIPLCTVDLTAPLGLQVEDVRSRFADMPLIDVAVANSSFVFRCRPEATDIAVIFDTFVGLYHLPPVPLGPAPVIVDLGSNIGCTLMHYAQLYPDCRLIGVELDEANCQLAQHNCRGLGQRCSIVHAAIWSSDGAVAYAGTEAWGYVIKPKGHTSVRAITMSSLIAAQAIERIHFLKIDIEGAEEELFSGDLSWLKRVDSLHVELHNQGPAFTEDLLKLLETQGFAAAQDSRHWSAIVASREAVV